MSYAPEDFWQAYGEYIKESLGRHMRAVQALGMLTTSQTLYGRSVLDLGCGKHREARDILMPKKYLGVDVDPPEDPPERQRVLKADYRTELGIIIDTALNPFKDMDEALFPKVVTSLFSIEITDIADNNYAIYQQLFRDLPTVEAIVVSGFYYTDKWTQTTVQEAGGLTSFQTIDLLLPEPEDQDFTEYRVYLPAPSKLFGPNVVEVWKLLARN